MNVGRPGGPSSRTVLGAWVASRSADRIGLWLSIGVPLWLPAVALVTAHRVVEGATLALTPSFAVVAALLIHSASEGIALGALLGRGRRNLTTWLAISAAGPVVGLAVASVSPLPDAAIPVLLALVGGVLLRTAVLGLQLAAAKRRAGELTDRHLVAAVTAALALMALTIATH